MRVSVRESRTVRAVAGQSARVPLTSRQHVSPGASLPQRVKTSGHNSLHSRGRAASVTCQAVAKPWTQKEGRLVLEDGTVFKGRCFGASGTKAAEIVFNTSLSGYQEIMTDPSYRDQMVCFTYPHIGNTGINEGARP
jgi:Carbamoyl-phosphate synthase small chain, CPSase domain